MEARGAYVKYYVCRVYRFLDTWEDKERRKKERKLNHELSSSNRPAEQS